MRGILFISAILAMGYVAYLQMNSAKEHDLDKAQNRVDQTEAEVNKIMNDYEKKLDNTMP